MSLSHRDQDPHLREEDLDFLCDRALVGVDRGEGDRLRTRIGNRADADAIALELCAAAVDVGIGSGAESMPDQIKNACKRRLALIEQPLAVRGTLPFRSPSPWSKRAGWLVAAAAASIAIVAIALPYVRGDRSTVTPSERGRSGVRVASGLAPVTLAHTEDPLCEHASGEIVWDSNRQAGSLHITGLAANDPTQHQYQLWIFDGTRDDRYPIDGGLFDMPKSGDATIDIRPPLTVREPTLFAVTVEPPGGSVVSQRRIVLVGKLPSSG